MGTEDVVSASRRMGEKNDCAVRAVALATGELYRKVHHIFAEAGRRKGRGTPRWMTRSIVARLGCKLTDVTRHFKSKTVRMLERELPKEGTFLIWVRGHVLSAVDGKVCDWTAGRLHRIRRIDEVHLVGTSALSQPRERLLKKKQRPVRKRVKIFGHPVTAILRWMGANGWGTDKAERCVSLERDTLAVGQSTLSCVRDTIWTSPEATFPGWRKSRQIKLWEAG